MKRLALLAAGLAGAAACSSGPASVGARFAGPAALVEFYGYTRNNLGAAARTAGIQPYLAVADARGGDLRLLDPSVDQPILGPGVVYPLSVSTQPRPLRLAAASIPSSYPTNPADPLRPDVLVVASAGSRVVQVVETWSEQNRVAFEVDLASAVSGVTLPVDAEITGLVGLTTAATDGTPLGRILVAVTGQQLFVLDFARAPTGDAVELRAAARQQLTFDPVDLAVGPDTGNYQGAIAANGAVAGAQPKPSGTTVYAATRDALLAPDGSTVHGVVELAAGGADPTVTFPATVWDARAPTVAVAAAAVAERLVSADPCAAEEFEGQLALRVYAVLAPDACGVDQAMPCGLATLTRAAAETAGHLVADRAQGAAPALSWPGYPEVPSQAFRAPMPIPGYPLHVAVAMPPAKTVSGGTPPAQLTTSTTIPSSTCPTSSATPLARVLYYGGALRAASALAMVTSGDGNVYWYDLSRSSPVFDANGLLGSSLTAVFSATSDLVAADQWQLGLWRGDEPVSTDAGPAAANVNGVTTTPQVVVDALNLPAAISVWPGFTPSASWTATYQGALPGLSSRPGLVAVSNGVAWVGITADQGPQGGVADPALGVRAADEGYPTPGGDFVTFPDLNCSARVARAVVATRDAAGNAGTDPTVTGNHSFPGGALQLDSAACFAEGVTAARVTILAADVVVASDFTGYAGRAPISLTADDRAGTFSLAWQDESLLTGTDRPTQEKLAVARRARRLFYPSDGPCPLPGASAGTVSAASYGCYTAYPRLGDPLAPGPALRFRVGVRNVSTPDLAPTVTALPPQGVAIRFSTQNGLSMTSRRPSVGGLPPATLVPVDPGDLVGHGGEDFRFYVAYQDDVVTWFSTVSTPSQVTSLR